MLNQSTGTLFTGSGMADQGCHNRVLWQVTNDKPGPFGNFLFYVILTISYCGRAAFSIETSSLPNDSARPLFRQIEIFLVDRLHILTASTFLYIRMSYQDSSLISASGRNPCGGTEHRKMLRVFFKTNPTPIVIRLQQRGLPMFSVLVKVDNHNKFSLFQAFRSWGQRKEI